MYTEDVDELERQFREVFTGGAAAVDLNNTNNSQGHRSHTSASVMCLLARDKRDMAKVDAFLGTTHSLIRKYRRSVTSPASQTGRLA